MVSLEPGTHVLCTLSHVVALIRKGSARLFGSFGTRLMREGDLVLLSAEVTWGTATFTRADIVVARYHPAFLVEQVRWTLPPERRRRRHAKETILRRVDGVCVIPLDPARRATFDAAFDRLLRAQREASERELVVNATDLAWRIGELFESEGAANADVRRRFATVRPLRRELRRALDLLHDRYHETLTVTELARAASLSESALRRAFAKELGMSPREYLHVVRLARFEQLITETTLTVDAAARAVGWQSSAHARRALRRKHGVSPSRFRAQRWSDAPHSATRGDTT